MLEMDPLYQGLLGIKFVILNASFQVNKSLTLRLKASSKQQQLFTKCLTKVTTQKAVTNTGLVDVVFTRIIPFITGTLSKQNRGSQEVLRLQVGGQHCALFDKSE